MAKHNETGKLGEDIACAFLVQRGFTIVERNYWRKWGEIDIVASRQARDKHGNVSREIHFVEVKSTERPHSVARESDDWAPEEMVHSAKVRRLQRVIETYCLQYDIDEWVFDVLVVYINKGTRTARCKMLRDVAL